MYRTENIQVAGMAVPSSARSCATCTHEISGPWTSAPAHCIERLDRLKRNRTLSQNDTVYLQDTPNEGLHCVSKGVVGIYVTHQNGTDVLVDLAYPGDTLGARAFLRNAPHQTAAVALTDGAVCTILRRDALKLTQDAPTVYLEIVKRCLTAMDQAQANIVEQACLSNRVRLCRLLLRLIERHGHVRGGAHVACLPISRAAMAGMLGIQPESLSRLFSRLKRDGLIEFSGRHVSVASLEALRKVSTGDD